MIKETLSFFQLLLHRKKYVCTIIIYMVMYLVERSFAILTYYILGNVGETSELTPVAIVLLIISLSQLCSYAVSYVAGLMENRVIAESCAALRKSYVHNFLGTAPIHAEAKAMGEISVLLREDLPEYVSYAGAISNFLILFPGATLIAIGTFVVEWRLFLVAIISCMAQLIITNKLQAIKAKKIFAKREKEEAGIHALIEATKTVQIARWITYLNKLIRNHYETGIHEIRKAQREENEINCILNCVQQMVEVLSDVGFLGVGGLLVFRGEISVGLFLAIYSVRSSLAAVAKLYVSLRDSYREFQVAKERLDYFNLTAEDVPDITRKERFERIDKLIVDDISFSYRDERRIINKLSFSAGRGERIRLVGESGSGKSTVVSVCSGMLYPDEGHFWGIVNGEKVLLDRKMRWVATVFAQSFYIFSGTVYDNIRVAKQDASDAEIRQAAKKAAIDEVIMRLPKGYDTELHDNGSDLSLGQRQRIMIARAILSNRPVWLMDEITSALDIETAEEVINELLPHMKEKIVIFTSHKRKEEIPHTDIVECEGYRNES